MRQHADKVDQINIDSFIESGLLRWQATLAMTIQGERALASLNF